MPSLLGHAAAGATLSVLFRDGGIPQRRTRNLAIFCTLVPDLDWFMSFLDLPGRHMLNHRGVTHSLIAAVLLAALVMLLAFKQEERRPQVWICMLLCALSHGLLDACTFGGVGVAVFIPVTQIRFVCAWQPIQVGPIPLNVKLLRGFLEGLWSEAIWIGIPALVLLSANRVLHFIRGLRVEEGLYESIPESPEP